MLTKEKTIVSKSSWIRVSLIVAAMMLMMSSVTGVAQAKKAEAQKADGKKNMTLLVDINNASAKELEGIKGVGAATAKKIIANRPYKTVDELSRAGLKPKAIEAIKPFVTVGTAQAAAMPDTAAKKATKAAAPVAADVTKATGDVKKTAVSTKAAAAKLAPGTRININTADQATMEKLPEIGPVKAKAIIAGRPYSKIEDIMKVSGIKGKTFEAIKDYIVVR